MSKIQTIKDKDGNIVYPQTAVQAIYDENGKTLNTVLTDFVKTDEAGSSVEDVNNNPELVANKVTSIDSNSTDTQYPSAKAVYNSILANKSVGIKISVVDELPTENIDDKTMYLKSNGTSETQNIYDEYLYVNNNWEHIGSTATTVDLSEYLKVSDAEDNYVMQISDMTMGGIGNVEMLQRYVGVVVQYKGETTTTWPQYQQGAFYLGTSQMYGDEAPVAAFTWQEIIGPLKVANSYTLGGIKIGDGLSVDGDGLTTLAPATASTIGGIKIGDGLSVDDSGVVSVSGSGIQNAENTNIQVAKIWVGTQTQYDAIETKDNNTEYNIIEE